jgi:hypothetical protein
MPPVTSPRLLAPPPRGRSDFVARYTTATGMTNRLIAVTVTMLACGSPASLEATEYVPLALHQSVALSDAVAIVRVVVAAKGVVEVEQVLKGELAEQISLIDYVDRFSRLADQRPLMEGARELVFLKYTGGGYAPLQEQLGRWDIQAGRVLGGAGGGLFTLNRRESGADLSAIVGSIQGLVDIQRRAAGVDDANVEALYLSGLQSADPFIQEWALMTAQSRLVDPSARIIQAVLPYWPRAQPLVANLIVTWRAGTAAPLVSRTLIAGNDDERAWAAFALGGAGDISFIAQLRETARTDNYYLARAWAYEGLRHLLGPQSLGDLRTAAKDDDNRVRSQAAVSAYNVLELRQPRPRWPSPSAALIAEVRDFLMEMTRDPRAANTARRMLELIAENTRPEPR